MLGVDGVLLVHWFCNSWCMIICVLVVSSGSDIGICVICLMSGLLGFRLYMLIVVGLLS